jgi:hypothetical protein
MESKIILKLKSLNNESEMENSLRRGLVRQNCSCGSGWCGNGSVNMQFDINHGTSVTE